ncbi:putative ribonuclease ZC3H12C [Taenia crassiceps]|uniref:Ribonuclease ZC3H12C n=1 Tax=Taenia crassiceps TaxID=6207 RepID=A0ABR4Q5Z4_9CEST
MYKTTVKIPTDFVNVDELRNYIERVYDVWIMTEPGSTSEMVIRTDLVSELEGAQNLSLLFIGPESKMVSELPVKILKIFTIPTIQRYLARSYKLIVTSVNCTHLIFRGSMVAVSIISKALLKIQLSKPCSHSLADENLIKLCRLHDIDIKQINDMGGGLHPVLYDFIVELESLMNAQDSVMENFNGFGKLDFIEVFRQNKSLQNQASRFPMAWSVNSIAAMDSDGTDVTNVKASEPRWNSLTRNKTRNQKKQQKKEQALLGPVVDRDFADLGGVSPPSSSGTQKAAKSASRPRIRNRAQSCDQLGTPLKEVRRLRPIVIDGANVAHGESSNSTFNVLNLRCVINYFVQRGHEEIAVVLPSDGQTPCAAVFSPTEIAKYFVFTPVRRLDRGVRPQKTDDDSVILQYAQEKDGVVISNDQYRDWLKARPEFRDLIENRVIPYSLRMGTFIISYYPLGKHKPHLDEILAFPR